VGAGVTDNLDALESWAAPLLAKLSPGERRKLATEIGRDLRRSQQQRVAAQRNPDGTPFAPRKPRQQLRAKRGGIKSKMFTKLRQARYLKLQTTAASIAVGFLGRAGRIARVHQEGLRDRATKDAPDVRYAKRELLGFTSDDRAMIANRLMDHLAGL
jgi:phage virion morphogenesis protein